MQIGVQFTSTLAANQSNNFFTFNWPATWDVLWQIMPTSTGTVPQVQWTVSTQLSGSTITYWILVKNLTAAAIDIEGRYAILNI